MAGNKAVTGLPTVPSPIGGLLYIVKDAEDFKVEIGGPQGLAYLDATGALPSEFVVVTWDDVGGKPTTLAGYNITDLPWALVSGEPVFTTRWPTWTEVTGKPTTFAPTAHTHVTGDIVSGTFATARLGTGTASTSTWLRGDGAWTSIPTVDTVDWGIIVNEPIYTQRWPSWTEVTSKPTTFAPTAHTHTWTDISGEPVYATRWPTWTEVTGKPAFGTGSTANYATTATANTLALRDTSADIHARLFRSEYDTTNSDVNFIMTQVDTVSNNFIRPSTPLQVESVLGTTINSANRLVKRDAARNVDADTFTAAGNNFIGSTTAVVLGTNGGIGTVYLRPRGVASATNQVTVNNAGVVTAADFTSTSDERLKKEIVPVDPRPYLGNLLEFVSFVWKETDEEALGLIAQQVQQVAPEYVHEDEEGYLSIDKTSLVLEVALGLAKRVEELEAELYGKA